ncbi:hypothetical protein [Stenotrophomonas tumulicola]|uniref:Uncharacterized protein n=1 Tax=Stenotrophomonas tumulicola TaxID=1685415 RepID=A0A7W3IG41_9GAMM|nr:hypothetical protein [Stenotrophomonas tumulicola]MBA8680407.1 hypothetical protein [Stenotrophomonas tumulicola]
MKLFTPIWLTALLLSGNAGTASAGNTYYLCSYEIHEGGTPVVRRVEYYEPTLQAAQRKFEAFLRDLQAQGKAPRNLGCR